jgi:hypothetical protein
VEPGWLGLRQDAVEAGQQLAGAVDGLVAAKGRPATVATLAQMELILTSAGAAGAGAGGRVRAAWSGHA